MSIVQRLSVSQRRLRLYCGRYCVLWLYCYHRTLTAGASVSHRVSSAKIAAPLDAPLEQHRSVRLSSTLLDTTPRPTRLGSTRLGPAASVQLSPGPVSLPYDPLHPHRSQPPLSYGRRPTTYMMRKRSCRKTNRAAAAVGKAAAGHSSYEACSDRSFESDFSATHRAAWEMVSGVFDVICQCLHKGKLVSSERENCRFSMLLSHDFADQHSHKAAIM